MNFDIAVIGSGPGGYVAAIRGAQLGLKVAIIEKENLGGVCLNWGCIPTKALLKSAEVYHTLKNASEFGIECKSVSINMRALVERSRKVAGQLSGGIEHLMKKNKITVLRGTAKLESKDTITIYESSGKITTIKSKNVIIATGARARALPHIEVDGKLVCTYKEAMIPDSLPEKILVVGSGAIGIEFASFYSLLGSNVTIVEVVDRILQTEDEEVAAFAHKVFEKKGIRIITSAQVQKVEKSSKSVKVTISNNADQLIIETFSQVILAVGVVPNIEDIGLEKTKVQLEKGHIKVNQHMETSEPGIYAIGDVTKPPLLAHKASHEAVLCSEHIAGLKHHTIDYNNVPGCIYSHPQIASIGLTEAIAKNRGFELKVGRFPLTANGKALAIGDSEGFIKTIFNAKTGELLGCHMIGPEVTEMIQGIALLKTLEGTEQDIMNTIFPHPTVSEAIHESVLNAYGKALHI